MAFTPTPNLDKSNQLNGQQVILKDWRHAANLFNADQFRLAPKSNFLFHVSFGINPGALQNADLIQRYGQEINMLVKNIDLPSFSIDTEQLNQYNRKKVVQYKAKYGDIAIKFHDDNMGLINHLWQSYWSYYYADSRSATNPGAYARNAMKSYAAAMPNPYGFDNGSTAPFFNYIKIYQMARHEYVEYKLINPLVTSWNYNKVSYSDQGVHDFDMKIAYESVAFSVGAVADDAPEGFGLSNSHYDTVPSPLKGPNINIQGTPSFVQRFDTTGLAPGILANAINSVNQNQNTSGALGNVAGGIALATAGLGIFNALGGIGGIGNALGGIGNAIGGAVGAVGDAIGSAVGGIKDAVFPGADANASDGESSTDSPVETEGGYSPEEPVVADEGPEPSTVDYDEMDF
jgi:hypothetical protein